MTLTEMIQDVRDHDGVYYLTMVLPARLAATAVLEWASGIANVARSLGLRRLAVWAAVYGYDIADHDPADACWELHRQRVAWAYTQSGSFKPNA